MRVIKEDLKQQISIRHLPDCERIQKALATVDIRISIPDAERLWDSYSDDYCASWLMLPETDAELIDMLTEEVQ